MCGQYLHLLDTIYNHFVEQLALHLCGISVFRTGYKTKCFGTQKADEGYHDTNRVFDPENFFYLSKVKTKYTEMCAVPSSIFLDYFLSNPEADGFIVKSGGVLSNGIFYIGDRERLAKFATVAKKFKNV